jgi:hypothetical protein
MKRLKKGEVICPKCKGKGRIDNDWHLPCMRCKGSGKLDWVQRVIEEPPIFGPYDSLMMPLLRTFYPKLIAKDLISVQPVTYKRRKNGTKRR